MDKLELLKKRIARDKEAGAYPTLPSADLEWMIAEIERLRYLIGWVDDNASFTADEWPDWETRRDSKEPWLLD